jgi:hypothetical protein
MQGRFFRTGNDGLGELPETALRERGELGINSPFGFPPAGDQYIPSAPGQPAFSVGENQSNWQSIPFTVGTDAVKLDDFRLRKFLVIQNLSGAGTLLFGFGWTPSLFNALVLPPGVGYEPFRYPTNEIWVAATAAGTQGLLIFGS